MTRRRILSALASLPALFLPRSWARASVVRPRMMAELIDQALAKGDHAAIATSLWRMKQQGVYGVHHRGSLWSGYPTWYAVDAPYPKDESVPLASETPVPAMEPAKR